MSKINALYCSVKPGAPVTSADLAALGVSADLAVHYVRAGWLTRLARGVFARPDIRLIFTRASACSSIESRGYTSEANRHLNGTVFVTMFRNDHSCSSTAGHRDRCHLGSPHVVRAATAACACSTNSRTSHFECRTAPIASCTGSGGSRPRRPDRLGREHRSPLRRPCPGRDPTAGKKGVAGAPAVGPGPPRPAAADAEVGRR